MNRITKGAHIAPLKTEISNFAYNPNALKRNTAIAARVTGLVGQ
jgi:hypothetical protein